MEKKHVLQGFSAKNVLNKSYFLAFKNMYFYLTCLKSSIWKSWNIQVKAPRQGYFVIVLWKILLELIYFRTAVGGGLNLNTFHEQQTQNEGGFHDRRRAERSGYSLHRRNFPKIIKSTNTTPTTHETCRRREGQPLISERSDGDVRTLPKAWTRTPPPQLEVAEYKRACLPLNWSNLSQSELKTWTLSYSQFRAQGRRY